MAENEGRDESTIETRKKLAEGVGAFVVDGRLIDGPFITEAEHTVALAKRLGLLS